MRSCAARAERRRAFGGGGEDRGSESICIFYGRQMVIVECLAGHDFLLGKSENMFNFVRGIRRLVIRRAVL